MTFAWNPRLWSPEHSGWVTNDKNARKMWNVWMGKVRIKTLHTCRTANLWQKHRKRKLILQFCGTLFCWRVVTMDSSSLLILQILSSSCFPGSKRRGFGYTLFFKVRIESFKPYHSLFWNYFRMSTEQFEALLTTSRLSNSIWFHFKRHI